MDEPIVLVVGASSGIGRATARLLSARHARLALAARSAADLAQVEHECLESGATQVLVVPANVTDAAAVDHMVSEIVAAYGRIDAIVHCAAVLAYGRFDDIPAEVFDQVIRTNVGGTANVARAGLRQFRAQGGGRLVLVSSLLGKVALPYLSPYVTSKWAVHGLAAVLRQELRTSPGIEVSVVSPGSVDTPIYARAATYLGWHGRPIPPVDQPDRVAAEVVRTVARPRRERSVGRLNHLVVGTFRLLPGLFDRLAGPVTRRFGVQRSQRVPPTSGNVFESS
jgi:NAD(P)-dependent dehydrogenase (short-subunit alcohol dehydrogenase family)